MKSGQLMRQVVNKISGIDFNNLSERQHFGDIYEQVLNDLQSAGNAGEYYTPRAVTAFMTDRIDPHPGELLFDPACGTGGFLTCAIRHMRDRYVKKVEDEREMQGALRAVEKKQLPHMLCVTNMLLHGIEVPGFVRRDNTLARPYVSYTASDRVDIVLTNPPFGGREEDGIESNFPAHFRTRETADLFLALIIRLLKHSGRAAVVLPDGSLFGEGVKTRLKEHLLEECNLHTIVRLPNSVFKPYANIGTNLLFFEKGEPTKEIWFYEHRVPEGQKAYSMTRPIRLEHFKSCVEWWGGAERAGRVENESAWRVTIEDVKARGYNLDVKNPHTVADDYGNPEELLAGLDEAEREANTIRDQLKAILREALIGSPDAELIDAFMRTRETGEGTVLEVAVVEWHGPHEQGLCWEEYQSWVGKPTDTEVKAAQERALADPELFKQCNRCGELCNVGNMHDDTICQGCAERYLGVVH
jgi:type I restriction enzyme M protein